MTNNSTIERDQYICQDYTDGMEIHELSRTYGVSERRISQILSENNITRRPRSTQQKSALSNHHTRLIWASTSTPTGATDDLGWSGGRLGGRRSFAALGLNVRYPVHTADPGISMWSERQTIFLNMAADALFRPAA